MLRDTVGEQHDLGCFVGRAATLFHEASAEHVDISSRDSVPVQVRASIEVAVRSAGEDTRQKQVCDEE